MAHRDDVSLGVLPGDIACFRCGTNIQMAVPAEWNLEVGDTIDWSCDEAIGTAEVVSIGRTVEEGMVYNFFKWIS